MKRSWTWILLAGVGLLTKPAAAEDILARWAQDFDTPQVQQAILNRIFSGQVGPLSEAILNKDTGIYLFPKGDNNWVRLGPDKVYVPVKAGGPYLVVSCMFYNKPDRAPVTATSYVFLDAVSRPEAISGGYAGQESVQDLKLPKLGKRFLVLIDLFGQGNNQQVTASVLTLGTDRHPRVVWKSPLSVRNVQFGFYAFSESGEELVLRTLKSGEMHYSAYRWTGDRFELDEFASERQLKALPDSVWKYGL